MDTPISKEIKKNWKAVYQELRIKIKYIFYFTKLINVDKCVLKQPVFLSLINNE